ncbi:hypothetical protein [Methanobrevibacter sp.]|uniref:hypothetical protein n=1 Tax=Methanobrevibacter sp. TaxID=66852 RepID=UPI0025D91D67|nr:hypothetical protein [Methanobrevibacter sp.]MBR4448313.1 hypothetical protein [Methanobrevibacter sp.]
MSHRYVRQNRNSFAVVKNSKTYGKFSSLDEALFLRDELIENEWDLSSIKEIYEFEGEYLVVKVIDGRLDVLGRYEEKPAHETIEKLAKNKSRNPNNSRYGLNITKIFDTYVIKKRIAGDDYIFGYFDNLQDAEFVRNFLLEHNWNVNDFSQIEYDEDTDTYKVIEVIDERVYVLDTFESQDQISIKKSHEEFLNRITKHKLGLAQHSNLDELTGRIPELEERFNANARDDVWSFKNTQDPLNDIIFNLTPFQKSVYDAIDNSTFDDIKKSLIRYQSKNFDEKIQRNLDELEEMDLILRNQNNYIKRSQ